MYPMRILTGLLITLGLVSSPALAEPVGKLLVVAGQVVAKRGGQDIPLASGASVEKGDLIVSADKSNAQLRMTDGAIIAIRPNTALNINDYVFKESEGTGKAAFELLRGGFRTVTGIIGKAQPENYRVQTPTSTIGIRGTHYSVRHCANDCQNPDGTPARNGTFGRVFDGTIFVENAGGTRDVSKDESFYVENEQAAPQLLIAPPDLLADRLDGQGRVAGTTNQDRASGEILAKSGMAAESRLSEPATGTPQMQFVTTETLNASGTTSAINALPSNSAVAWGFSFNQASSYFSAYTNTSASDGETYIAGPLSSVTSIGDAFANGGGAARNGATLADSGSNSAAGNVSWGRWVYDATTNSLPIGYNGGNGSVNPGTGVHFAYGDAPTNVPTTGSAIFSWVGGTLPTNASGQTGTWSSSPTLSVNFVNQTMSTLTSAPLQWTVGSYTFTATLNNVPVGSNNSANVTGSYNCNGPCNITTFVNSTFAGSNASGLLLSIATSGGDAASTTTSVQVYKR